MRISSLPVAIWFFAAAVPVFGAKYAGDFMYLGAGGRPLSLGGAYVASSGDVLSGYYNPAGLSSLNRSQAIFMHSETFGSLLNHDFLAYAGTLGADGRQAAFAISLYRLGGGGIIVTEVDQTGRFRVKSEENHADYVGYFSYGRKFGSRYSGGLSAKLIYRDIVDESAFGIGLDVGAICNLTKWADIGVNLQDIPGTLLSYTTGTKQRVNPTAKVGLGLHGGRGAISGSLFADADLRFEGRKYSAQADVGRISLDSHLGIEAVYMGKISARVGSDVGDLSLGVGLHVNKFVVDVAMKDPSDLDNSYLVSLMVQF